MKVFKIIAGIIGILLLAFVGFLGYSYYSYSEALDTENKPFKHYVGYIDPEGAVLKDGFQLCNDGTIYHTYSSAGLKAYKDSKKRFRDVVMNDSNENTFTDSGYLNFRFFVNCDGNPGMFEVIEMDLDLKETPLNKAMVDKLLHITAKPENWEIIEYDDAPKNYYMYVSYRIENGKITEIIP